MTMQVADALEEIATSVPLDELSLSDAQLWVAFREQQCPQAREALFLRYLPFARRVALRTLRTHGITQVELADVYQSTSVALIQTIDRFDPSQGAGYKTYATHRIQGAVLDCVETQSELQQQISVRGRSRSERLQSLRQEDTNLAKSREGILDRLANISMGLAIGFMLENSSVYADPDIPLAVPDAGYETVAWRQTLESLQRYVDALPESESKVIAYHYFQGLDFEQVANLMGLSRSRISQIHKKGIVLLQRRLVDFEYFYSNA